MKQQIYDCKGRKINNDEIVVYGGLVNSILKKDQPFENVKKAAQGSFLKGGKYFTVNEFFNEFVKCYYDADNTILSRKTNSRYKGFQSFKSDTMLPCDNYWLYYVPASKFDDFNRIEENICTLRITDKILKSKGFKYFGRASWVSNIGKKQDAYFYTNEDFNQVIANFVTDSWTDGIRHSVHYSVNCQQEIRVVAPSEFVPGGYAYFGTRNIFFPIKDRETGAAYSKSFNEIKIDPLPNPNQFGEVDETFAKKRDLIGNIVLDYTKTDSDIYIDIRKDEEDDCILPGIF